MAPKDFVDCPPLPGAGYHFFVPRRDVMRTFPALKLAVTLMLVASVAVAALATQDKIPQKDVGRYVQRAEKEYKEGKLKEAIGYYFTVLYAFPEMTDVRFKVARIHNELGELANRCDSVRRGATGTRERRRDCRGVRSHDDRLRTDRQLCESGRVRPEGVGDESTERGRGHRARHGPRQDGELDRSRGDSEAGARACARQRTRAQHPG